MVGYWAIWQRVLKCCHLFFFMFTNWLDRCYASGFLCTKQQSNRLFSSVYGCLCSQTYLCDCDTSHTLTERSDDVCVSVIQLPDVVNSLCYWLLLWSFLPRFEIASAAQGFGNFFPVLCFGYLNCENGKKAAVTCTCMLLHVVIASQALPATLFRHWLSSNIFNKVGQLDLRRNSLLAPLVTVRTAVVMVGSS